MVDTPATALTIPARRAIDRDPTQIVDWEVFVNQPFFPSHARLETAQDAYKSVLSDVGCTLPVFDDHDKRIIRETLTGTYTYMGSKTKLGGIIDHQNDAGGYEDYPELTRPADFDSDHDGLPDWWENLHGSNPNSVQGDFTESNADPDKRWVILLWKITLNGCRYPIFTCRKG